MLALVWVGCLIVASHCALIGVALGDLLALKDM
jgi:hypothetical protein